MKSPELTQARSAVDASWNSILESLQELVRIPSISFPQFDPGQVQRSAQATAQLFRECGWSEVEVVAASTGAPAVLAAWNCPAGAPTILLYAHHDVQPPMREALWHSPPFQPEIREGRLYGRGAADDKAGVVLHAWCLPLLLKSGLTPRVNLRVLIEGEEETGSVGLESLLATHADFLRADAVIVADLANWDTGQPALTTSLRGMVGLEVELRGTAAPLHSGLWSGPIPDPAAGLARLLASLYDENGQVCVADWDRGLTAPTPEEEAHYQSLGLSAQTFRQQARLTDAVPMLCCEEEIPLALWRRPTLTITTLQAGDRRNAGNVLQDSAWARIGLRIAPGMDWRHALATVQEHLRQHVPWGLQLLLHPEEGADPWSVGLDHPALRGMLQCMEQAYDHPTRIMGCGASIPGAQLFSKAFPGAAILLTGLEDPHSNAHGENESLDLGDLRKSLLAQILFLSDAQQWLMP